MSDAIRDSVDSFLSDPFSFVKFEVKYSGETKRNDWQCDAWRVQISSSKGVMNTDYFTGMGHRKGEKNIQTPFGLTKGLPVKPRAADVLDSLVLDSAALDTSFEYWCSDYGYDSDSIKAFDTYRACCDTGKKLRSVFTQEQIQTLRDMLQDF